MNTPQAIRGTQDIFGAEAEAFARVVETFETVRKLYRFRRAEMPVFEKTAVFSRSLGETTDVVSVCLPPSAGDVRALVYRALFDGATVVFDTAATSADAIATASANAGYPARVSG